MGALVFFIIFIIKSFVSINLYALYIIYSNALIHALLLPMCTQEQVTNYDIL